VEVIHTSMGPNSE